LFGAAPVPEVEGLMRRGNTAFTNGDYQAALDLFTQAEEYTTDPGLVAFNKAAALYRLGRYAEAEAHYLRSREDARGERRARLLFDLGNAVLQVARDQDVKGIQRAIGYYEECLRQEAAGPHLIEDAKFNLQMAKELLARARAAKGSQKPDEANDGSDRPRDEQANQGAGGMDFRPGLPDRRGQARAVNRRPGDVQRLPGSSAQEPPPGQGDLPPIQDQDELIKMSPEETARYLDEVAARVLRERREHRRQSRPPGARNVMDW
jgi:tetratricopeptide (TPR) repeat protein